MDYITYETLTWANTFESKTLKPSGISEMLIDGISSVVMVNEVIIS